MPRTVIVDFHKWFDEDMKIERPEIPTDVTIGQLMDLLAQVQPETFRDSWFLEIPVEVTPENAASFVGKTRMEQNVAFVSDIMPLL